MAKTASVGLRFLPELKEAAERAAQDDHRSLASLVERVLTEWLEAKGYLPAPAKAPSKAPKKSSRT